MLTERRYDTGADQLARSVSWETNTRRLAGLTAQIGSVTVQDDVLAYDDDDNVTRVRETPNSSQRQCFVYDHRARLTHGWTTGTQCTDENDPDTGYGVQGYEVSYAYNSIANIANYHLAGTNPRDYDYDDPAHPHAPTDFGSDWFAYNANGDLTSASATGGGRAYSWSADRLLVSATTISAMTTFAYWADGSRAMRRAPDGTVTVTLGADELTITGGSVTGRRYYQIDRTTIGVRDNNTFHWLIGNHQGSVAHAVQANTTNHTTRRYLPNGNPRQPAADLPGDRGFLAKTEDETTGFVHLDARYYNPTTQTFISVDPLADPTNPQTLNPYTYAHNNPTTLSDPTGYRPCDDPRSCSAQGTAAAGTWTFETSDVSGDRHRIHRDRYGNIDYVGVIFADSPDEEHNATDTVLAEPEGPSLGELFAELTGWNDIKNCAGGSASSCAWAAIAIVPSGRFGKLARFAKTGENLDDLRDAVRILPGALKAGRNADAGVHVYLGVRNGKPIYVGITSNIESRAAQHGARFDGLRQVTGHSVTRGEARAIEEALIVRNPGFENIRHSISPTHPYYNEAVEWGEAWLQGHGY